MFKEQGSVGGDAGAAAGGGLFALVDGQRLAVLAAEEVETLAEGFDGLVELMQRGFDVFEDCQK